MSVSDSLSHSILSYETKCQTLAQSSQLSKTHQQIALAMPQPVIQSFESTSQQIYCPSTTHVATEITHVNHQIGPLPHERLALIGLCVHDVADRITQLIKIIYTQESIEKNEESLATNTIELISELFKSAVQTDETWVITRESATRVLDDNIEAKTALQGLKIISEELLKTLFSPQASPRQSLSTRHSQTTATLAMKQTISTCPSISLVSSLTDLSNDFSYSRPRANALDILST